MFDHDDGFGVGDALLLGTGYALVRHGQDAQTDRIVEAIDDLNDRLDDQNDEPEGDDDPAEPINALDFTSGWLPDGWDDYIGQEPLKRQLMVRVASAKARGVRLEHILLESGFPGVGKTTMARLLGRVMGTPKMIELVPPFKEEAFITAAMSLPDMGILFIDEIHKMTDGVGTRGAEILLKALEEGVIFEPDGTVHVLHDITIIGATTEADRLPDPVLDRFKVHPYFQAYSQAELARITVQFVYHNDAEGEVSHDAIYAISGACRGIPRVCESMVTACRDLTIALRGMSGDPTRMATPEEMLDFLEVEPDGMTRKHIAYLTALRQFYARVTKEGETEYIIGEPAIMQRLRETKQGIGRIEDFILERGLIDRTPRGRRLTALGIKRAEEYIAQGKGFAAHAA